MSKKVFFIIIFFFIAATGHSQTTWFKTYGGDKTDEGWDVQQTEDGGFIIAGRTNSFGEGYKNIYLVRTDSSGNMIWQKTYGGKDNSDGFCVQPTLENGYAIFGSTSSFDPQGYGNIYLIKTDNKGDTLWTRTYGRGIGFSGQQLNDGGYAIAGTNFDAGVLIRTDAAGDTIWIKTFAQSDLQFCYDFQPIDDGYILTGEVMGYAALVKTDPLGNKIWSKRFGAKKLDRGYSVQQTNDGGYILTGIQYIPGGSESESCIFLIKTDVTGDTLWTQKVGEYNSEGRCIRQTLDGGYVITGFTAGYSWPYFICLIKTDNQGLQEWSRKFDIGEGKSLQLTRDGGFIITGDVLVPNRIDHDVVLLKTDGAGNITSVKNSNRSQNDIPKHFRLYQNYPNPVTQITIIQYEVFNKNQNCNIVIYDVNGKQVKSFIRSHQNTGMYEIEWNGNYQYGNHVASGVYFYKIEVGGHVKVYKKLLLIN